VKQPRHPGSERTLGLPGTARFVRGRGNAKAESDRYRKILDLLWLPKRTAAFSPLSTKTASSTRGAAWKNTCRASAIAVSS